MSERTAIAIEAGLLCSLILLMILWIIPAQTVTGGIGLDPADLPTACAVAIALLAIADGVIRLARPVARPAPDASAPSRNPRFPGSMAIPICLGAAAALPFVSVTIVSALITPLLMIAVGETRLRRIVLTTASMTSVLVLALGWT